MSLLLLFVGAPTAAAPVVTTDPGATSSPSGGNTLGLRGGLERYDAPPVEREELPEPEELEVVHSGLGTLVLSGRAAVRFTVGRGRDDERLLEELLGEDWP